VLAPEGRLTNGQGSERGPGVPAALRDRYADRTWEVAWRGAPQTVVYRLSRAGREPLYVKLADLGWHPDPVGEGARLRWAAGRVPVPGVVESGADDGVAWLVTRGLRGVDATHHAVAGHPARLAELLARGLRGFHAMPVSRCPFDFRLDRALESARGRLERGLIDPARDFHPEHAHLSAEKAVRTLELTRPPTEDVVVCHGDYCPPNVLVDGGEVVGFLDVGELGVADRWWDLAVATWSLTWNLGPGHEGRFLETYGVEPDPERTAFYRLLYDVVS